MKKRRRLRERRRAVVATAFEAIFKDTTKRLSWILFVSVNWWCGNGGVGLGFIDEGWVGSFLVLLFLLFNVLPFLLPVEGKRKKKVYPHSFVLSLSHRSQSQVF